MPRRNHDREAIFLTPFDIAAATMTMTEAQEHAQMTSEADGQRPSAPEVTYPVLMDLFNQKRTCL